VRQVCAIMIVRKSISKEIFAWHFIAQDYRPKFAKKWLKPATKKNKFCFVLSIVL